MLQPKIRPFSLRFQQGSHQDLVHSHFIIDIIGILEQYPLTRDPVHDKISSFLLCNKTKRTATNFVLWLLTLFFLCRPCVTQWRKTVMILSLLYPYASEENPNRLAHAMPLFSGAIFLCSSHASWCSLSKLAQPATCSLAGNGMRDNLSHFACNQSR